MQWMLYYYCRYPAWQKIIQEEADKYLNHNSDFHDLAKMDVKDFPQTYHFMREVFRLRPASSGLVFDTVEDTSVQGVLIPKGTQVIATTRLAGVLCTPGQNRYEFDPTRWDESKQHPETIKRLNAVCFSTFGSGPRMCPGRHMAMVQLLYVLVGVYACFDATFFPLPESVYEVEEAFSGTTKPKNFYPHLLLRPKYASLTQE
jgi:cytochrome P450